MSVKVKLKLSNTKKKKKRISGGKRQVIIIGLIRLHWFGGKCMWGLCEITTGLEFAHVVETELSRTVITRRSSWERLQDLLNYPECFLLFCSEHHRVYDNRDVKQTWRNNYKV